MSIFDRVAQAVTQKAVQKIQTKIPKKIQQHLPLARKLLYGGPEAFVNAGLDLLLERFGVLGGAGSRIPGTSPSLRAPTPLLGGITLKQAREIFEQSAAIDFAKKNLWCIRVTNLNGGMDFEFNFFATDVSYTPFTIAGEAVHVGSGSFDTVTNAERVEMRVTTLDDAYGSVKRWFYDRKARMTLRDGTVGLPVDYLFRVEVMHAFPTEQAYGSNEAFWDTYIMRPGGIEIDLSRRDDGLQELQLSFVQFDTFTALT